MDKIRVFYLRDASKFPVACVASRRNGNSIEFSVSTHNPNDRYSKSYGRSLATERLLSGDSLKVLNLPGQIKRQIVHLITQFSNMPRAAKAAEAWLATHQEAPRLAAANNG